MTSGPHAILIVMTFVAVVFETLPTHADKCHHHRVVQVIYCAAARSTFTADLLRVEDRGVMNIVKAMQVRTHKHMDH